jgi:hypothetical protein
MNRIFFSTLIFLFLGISSFGQNVDKEVQDLLQEKRVANLNDTTIMGYRIQLYYGLSQTKASNIQNSFTALYPDVPTRLFYKQPDWKVHVGNFRTSIDAEKFLQKIKKDFGNAFVKKTKINI